jgi:hypothetical protein
MSRNTYIFFLLLLVCCLFNYKQVFAEVFEKNEGFKDIKFGMKDTELTKLGFECKYYGMCLGSDENKYTLFSYPANAVSVDTKDNIVYSIGVTINVRQDKLVELFTEALGTPDIWKYVSATGINVEVYYWLFSNHTSISIQTSDKQRLSNDYYSNFSRAYYKDRDHTEQIIQQANKSKVIENLKDY